MIPNIFTCLISPTLPIDCPISMTSIGSLSPFLPVKGEIKLGSSQVYKKYEHWLYSIMLPYLPEEMHHSSKCTLCMEIYLE